MTVRKTYPKTKPKTRTEAEVTRGVLDAAKLYGIALERSNTGLAFGADGRAVRFGTPGDPDLRATVPGGPSRGRTLMVEVKAEAFEPRKSPGRGRHFARQLARMEEVNAAGGLAVWFRDAADAERFFARVMDTPGLRVEFDADGFPEWTDEPNGR